MIQPAFLTVCTGSNEGVVRDHIGLAVLPMHIAEQLQRKLPAPRYLACANQGAVCDHIALAATTDHVLENLERFLHLHAHETRQRHDSVKLCCLFL